MKIRICKETAGLIEALAMTDEWRLKFMENVMDNGNPFVRFNDGELYGRWQRSALEAVMQSIKSHLIVEGDTIRI